MGHDAIGLGHFGRKGNDAHCECHLIGLLGDLLANLKNILIIGKMASNCPKQSTDGTAYESANTSACEFSKDRHFSISLAPEHPKGLDRQESAGSVWRTLSL